jgi:hypothetical protein
LKRRVEIIVDNDAQAILLVLSGEAQKGIDEAIVYVIDESGIGQSRAVLNVEDEIGQCILELTPHSNCVILV